MITIPRRKRGQSRASPLEAQYQADLQAILKYLPEDAPAEYSERLKPLRAQVRAEVLRLLAEEFGS